MVGHSKHGSMTNYIDTEKNGSILTVRLNRAEKKNALNGEMMQGLMELVDSLQNDKETDIVVLKGRGDSFCAGADLDWFLEASHLPEEERIAQLKVLSNFLRVWHRLPQTTITVGHGYLYGGALGLLAVSDFVILEQHSHLRLSEVLLGILPASIAPFLVRRMGFKRSKALMLSAEAFNAQIALAYGLADKIAPADQLLETEMSLIKNIQRSAGSTRAMLKEYLFDIVYKPIGEETAEISAKALSDSLESYNAQKLLENFHNKK